MDPFDEHRRNTRGRVSTLGPALGIVLLVGGIGALVCAAVEFVDGGPDGPALSGFGFGTALAGLAIRRTTRLPERIRTVDIFTVVTASWVVLSVVGALPYLLTGTITRVDDALFESVSGFTTTGATLLQPIESASAGLLFWRAMTQWIGGFGVIALVVAVLPVVGRGMDLLQAETSGPSGERLTPRVRDTARRLWAVYLGLSIIVGFGYLAAGMTPYDAVAHAFTTVSTGGFSPHTGSVGWFASEAIEWVAIVGMLAGGTAFALIYRALRGSVSPLIRSPELRLYFLVVLAATVAVLLSNRYDQGLGHDGIRTAAFNVISVVTTTGYDTGDWSAWAQGAQVVLLLLMPIGAMAGSTSGGVKMVRVLAVGSYAARELRRQLHPRLVRPLRIGADPLDDAVANRIVGHLVLALAIFGACTVAIAASGSDLVTAFSVAASSLGNVGPALGEAGPASDYLAIDAPARWASMVTMLLGRLEIYPVLLALAVLPRRHRRRNAR